MNPDDIKATPFVWETDNMGTGIIAQEVTSIDLSDINLSTLDTITLTSAQPTITITSGAVGASSYNWNTGSSVSFTDPYEEMEKRLKALEDIIAEEKAIRDQCPAVKTAYDEYRLLLVLAKRTTGDSLTDE